MAIQIRCSCGYLLRVRDSAAGKSVECPECFLPVDVPPSKKATLAKSDDSEPDFAAAAAMARECEFVDEDIEQAQREEIGELADKPAQCPWCGERVARAAPRCSHCKTSFRKGPCAQCGVTKSSWQHCDCEARPVIWGDGEFAALCTHCGREIRTRQLGETSCPWCATAALLRRRSRPGSTPPKNDSQRIAELGLIEKSLDRQVASAKKSAPGGGGLLLKAVVGGVLLGDLGVAIGSYSHNQSQAAHAAETGLYEAQSDSSSAMSLAKRLANEKQARKDGRLGWKDSDDTQKTAKVVLLILGAMGLLLFLILAAVAVTR